jgi:hypothetical protein
MMPYNDQPVGFGQGQAGMQQGGMDAGAGRDRITQALMNVQNPPPVSEMPQQPPMQMGAPPPSAPSSMPGQMPGNMMGGMGGMPQGGAMPPLVGQGGAMPGMGAGMPMGGALNTPTPQPAMVGQQQPMPQPSGGPTY